MSITDIFEETSKKYMNKNMVGDTVISGIIIGIVVENNNNRFPGMVRVKIPTRDDKRNILQWMKVVSMMGGKNWGLYCIPEINDEVVVAFENGNINKAYVIGSIFKNDSQMLTQNYTDENYKKVFTTKGGNQIFIDDEEDKQQITLLTKGGNKVDLNDKDKLISIADKDKKNIIEIDMENGKIEVKSESKFVMDINGIKVEMVGDSQKVSVSCDSLNIDANQQINIKGQTVNIDATTLNVNASGSAKISSDGVTQIKGATVKLGS